MKKIGRNDPCHCGSRQKYKNCHQPIDEARAPAPVANQAALSMAAQLAIQGNALREQDKLEEAVASFAESLALDPTRAEVHSNLGYVLDRLGRAAEAADCYRKAISIRPDVAELHSNLGLALQATSNNTQAEASFSHAIALNPDQVAGHFNLARLLQMQGRHKDAVASCRRVVALAPANAQAHNNLGVALEETGQIEESIASYRSALAIDPGLISAQKGVATGLGRLVPEWHVPMMNDTLRNEAYYAALRAVVSADSHVLEIGTGSGLLAMMAARLGAKSVVTCEAVPMIASVAKQVIADNGLDQQIRVHAKKSTDLSVGEELDHRADIMVSEILSSELLGERVLDSIDDAKRRLLKPNARIIPLAGSIMIALFGGEQIATNLAASESCGFDLRSFNTIVPQRQGVARNDLKIEILSADTNAFRFDFEGHDFYPPETKILRIPVTRAGKCLGIVQWIRLELIPGMVFENHPSVKAPASAWTHCVYLFPAPAELKAGQIVVVTAAHNRAFPWFAASACE